MIWTTLRRLVPVAFVATISVPGPAQGKDSLSVAANSPSVPVVPRNPGRSFIRLPTLEYDFEVRASCSDGKLPKSLSLNVADSRKSLAANQIISDGPTEFSLRIPASQIAPLVIEDFCITEVGEEGQTVNDARTQVSISSALSAQASLLCESDDDRTMTYVSQTLDVSLVCERPSIEEMPQSE